ncbi:PREDICTED: uncharacterized protein LOC106786057 [Polistes canadensis]|uniref:uncharacterized protein LOC106786057 n=1 Tax=Polistes canadensis TaxID=91411 RepID=UPI000718E18D|nr:PREDICTED: uncharacterized protein LOC106786057 [Polistes canadensis]
MESNKSSFDDKSNEDENLAEDASSDKRKKLEKEIEVLKDMVKQLQKKLKTVRLNNIKEGIKSQGKVGNTNKQVMSINLNHELYRYSGLYCAHTTATKQVIGFSSFWEQQKKNLYAIEFVKRSKKIQIGKWVMPMSVDIKQLLSEVTLDTKEDIVPFTRNCKMHVDCYMMRLQQYQQFKSFLDNLNNCNVQTNLGYTTFILELLHVYDKINESYACITIFLWYNSKNNRPNDIKFEVHGNIQYNTETEKELKKSLKVFYISDLITAFGKILQEDNAHFTWRREKKDDTISEIDESSDPKENEDSLSLEKSKNKIFKIRQKRTISLAKSAKRIKKDNVDKKLKQQDKNIKNPERPLQQEVHKEASTSKHMKNATSLKPSKIVRKQLKRPNNFTIQLRSQRKLVNTSKMINNNVKKVESNITSTPKRLRAKKLTAVKELPQLDISDIVDEKNND